MFRLSLIVPLCSVEFDYMRLSEFVKAEVRQTHGVEINKTITNRCVYSAKCSCGCVTKGDCAAPQVEN